MRLPIILLLVMLALGCTEATDIPCPTMVGMATFYLLGTPKMIKTGIGLFKPPPEDIEAIMKVKPCVDKLSFHERKDVSGIVTKIFVDCVI